MNFIEYLNFQLSVASKYCLKFSVILKHSQKFLKIPMNFWQVFRFSLSGKVIGALSWNSQDFLRKAKSCLLLTWNFWEFPGFQNQSCYSWEFLGIPRKKYLGILRILQEFQGIPRNSKIHFANVIVQTAISANID